MNFPLIKITLKGEITKPITVFLEKISNAIGTIYAPYHKVKMAKATSEANFIQELGKQNIDELTKRTISRIIINERRYQNNIDDIVQDSVNHINEDAKPENISDDWLNNFFDKAKLISDNDMQEIWSKILSGEANKPGSFSKRTVNIVSSISKFEANLFSNIMKFTVIINKFYHPMIFNVTDKIFVDENICYGYLVELERIGLINFFRPPHVSITKEVAHNSPIHYYDETFYSNTINNNNKLATGHVTLSIPGKELARICYNQKLNTFSPILKDYIANHSDLKF